MKYINWLLMTALALGACSKRYDKPLPTSPLYQNNNPGSAGSVRLVDLSQAGDRAKGSFTVVPTGLDLAVNGKRLTTFASPTGFTGPTYWFTSGKFSYGTSFTIPDSLFDPQGNALLQFYYVYFKTGRPADGGSNNDRLDSPVLRMSIPVHNDINKPQDILFYDSVVSLNPGSLPTALQLKSLTVQRPAGPSVQPDHFKIRLVNLTGRPFADPTNQLTLTYADGSKVDSKTTAVAFPGASDYLDLPFGTYQFKIKDRAGNVLGVAGDIYGYANMPLTYNPGGVYTLIAYNSTLQPNPNGGAVYYNPSYVLQTDIKPSAQPNYIRVQAIHAAAGLSNLHFSVDGQALGDFVSFGQQTGYGIFSIGPHKMQLLDGNGKELASRVLSDTYPLDNLSVWAYVAGGVAQLLVTHNDLSQRFFQPGSSGTALSEPKPPITTNMYGIWKVQFLNLSGDVPYASFIDNTGNFGAGGNFVLNDSSAWLHLAVGAVKDVMGVVTGRTNDKTATTISVFDSPPGANPGTPLDLTLDHPLVADSYPPGQVPSTEMGTYTIALIGTKTSGGDTLRMITIKHNQ